ncbi:LacI family DNA-binding transcriptional regulator [Chelatococcus asaccharovorans]|uniref:LacI family transcriptional regulator n=1 Tax=Chelatococcus asaccharovorans TaxID=28210 RepID=A0A2V3UH93_9HYPH|nr:substrate-binding domain-containing protein [Chelatococcus asaccharovorans]MBS7706618.1 substrate-binding domain-containing protein [Chelatococcus asaccharovorans]PXW64732.1 LacI family transcriptional regulator [Chelatococcus asaccharovorans]CAH1663492.1 LacI family transcriptional regulator [Chelatococcus asaccharovorans]CAH1682774.1 LacI family transcriptional regulator [Chelatococcus asaccharovorans]
MATRGTKNTIRDVALAAGVAVGTVSRVLNGHSTVKPEIKRRVQRAIDEMGYSPNAIAQSMRIGSTFTIGCVLREINVPQLAGFVRAAHDVLDEAGFSLLISNSEGRSERERGLLERLARRQADGVMIGPYTPIVGEFEAFLRELGIPIVLVDRDPVDWADGVMADHAGGTRLAVEHLIGLGHRRIALITGEKDLYPAKERIKGYYKAYEAFGLTVDPSLVQTGSFLPSAGFRFASALLGQRNPPTAILSGGIDMLSGVLRAIRSRGMSIPGDISVIGAGNSELAELHTPPISIVSWDQAEVGRVAAGLLLDRLRSQAAAEGRHVLVPNEFHLRASVGPPRT